jgi:hypothetical protein
MLCTLVMTDNVDAKGVARYPVGILPVMDPETGETLVDELGRRSYTTSIAYGPTIGKNIALAYLPWDYCQVGRKLRSSISARPIRSKLRRSATHRSTIRKTSSRGADRHRVTPMNDRAVKPDRSRLTGRSFFVLWCRRFPAGYLWRGISRFHAIRHRLPVICAKTIRKIRFSLVWDHGRLRHDRMDQGRSGSRNFADGIIWRAGPGAGRRCAGSRCRSSLGDRRQLPTGRFAPDLDFRRHSACIEAA